MIVFRNIVDLNIFNSFDFIKLNSTTMKKLLIAISILLSMYANAQNEEKRFDFRFGAGPSLLGTGDMRTIMFENELNYSINQYFTTSISVGNGWSDSGVYETASFFQGNLNLFVSLFKNNKNNDFRIGTGLSFMNISDVYVESIEWVEGKGLVETFKFDRRNSFGVNFIIEDSYSLSDIFFLGIKFFTQPYIGDINSGVLLKIGLKI
jgi:hypothetical protein